MNIDSQQISVDGVSVHVVRRPIKHLHLGVYPPEGRVRVAAPFRISDEAVRLAVVGKWGWVKRQIEKFIAQPRQSPREMVSGESHYFLGNRYRLRVLYVPGKMRVLLKKMSLVLYVPPGTTVVQRETLLQRWHRAQLKGMVPPLLMKWQSLLGLESVGWNIKQMKTRWGTMNIPARRMWLNLELAKKPEKCLEYVIVHELLHLFERKHNARFVSMMKQHIPQWEYMRQVLNQAPLSCERWNY
jgi:predicted metal-dependent hydrolase